MAGFGRRGRAGGHAVVIGGSIAGLLAARVLSEKFERVTVLDRDDVAGADGPRKGVPQGHHTHGLLARGCDILDELLPGFVDELVGRGAIVCDAQDDCVWYNDGLRVVPVGGTEAEELAADLVVNASGRGNRGTQWLRELGS
jgi:predicted NAD/FAD-dependent oxidoreductase